MILKNVKSVSQGPGDGDTVPGTQESRDRFCRVPGLYKCTARPGPAVVTLTSRVSQPEAIV